MSGVSITSRSPPARRELVWLTRPHAIYALIRRDWRIMRSYRTALVSDLVFGCLNLVVYYYISRTVKVSVRGGLDGAPNYFAFVAVGVSLSIVLQAATTGVSRRLREEQLTGTLEALYAQPISATEVALGLAGFPFLFAIIRAFLYLLIAGLLLGLSFAHCAWVGLFASFLVTGLALGTIGMALAALVLVFKRAETVGTLAIFGMCLLGGAFFSAHVLPHWARPLAEIVPTRFAFSAARGALFGGEWISPTLVLAGMAVGLGAASLLLFSRASSLGASWNAQPVLTPTPPTAFAGLGCRMRPLLSVTPRPGRWCRCSGPCPTTAAHLRSTESARTQPRFRRSPHSCAWIGRACASRSGRPTRFRSAM